MKELNDEELQRLLDEGKEIERISPLDGKVYQALFEALKTEPEAGLPFDFAGKVTRHVSAGRKRSHELRYNLLAAAIFLSLIAVLCGIMMAWGTVTTATLLKFKWLLLLIPIIFIAIQYFDQVLVKTKIFKNNPNS